MMNKSKIVIIILCAIMIAFHAWIVGLIVASSENCLFFGLTPFSVAIHFGGALLATIVIYQLRKNSVCGNQVWIYFLVALLIAVYAAVNMVPWALDPLRMPFICNERHIIVHNK